jgi:hypothetical protein
MTITEKVTILRDMTGSEDKDATLADYLASAAKAVCNCCYPFDETKTEVPNRYAMDQIEIAAYLLNKRGAEGQLSHSENGISRSYEAASIPESMLKRITPYCGVVQ